MTDVEPVMIRFDRERVTRSLARIAWRITLRDSAPGLVVVPHASAEEHRATSALVRRHNRTAQRVGIAAVLITLAIIYAAIWVGLGWPAPGWTQIWLEYPLAFWLPSVVLIPMMMYACCLYYSWAGEWLEHELRDAIGEPTEDKGAKTRDSLSARLQFMLEN